MLEVDQLDQLDRRAVARQVPDARDVGEEAGALGPLDRTVDLTRLRGEALAWAGVLALAAGIRLAGLAGSALAPGEARRAFAAFGLYSGRSADLGLEASGPFGTIFGALLYFLFGVSDQIARLGPALAGVGLVLLTVWLRPYLGRAGALVAGLLLAISPAFAYFSRSVQGAIYSQFFALLLFVALLRALDHGRRGDVVLAAAAAALLVLTGPVGLTLLVLFAFLGALLWARARAGGGRVGAGDAGVTAGLKVGNQARGAGAIALLTAASILLLGYSAFGTAPGNLVRGPADLLGSWGGSLFGPAGGLPGRGPGFALGLLLLYEPLALVGGLWAVARLVTGGGAATEGRGTLAARALLAVWAVVGIGLLALGGGNQPWLLLLPTLPLTLLAGAAVGDLLTAIEWRRDGWFWRDGGALLALVALLLVAAWGSVGGLLVLSPTLGSDTTWFAKLALTLFGFALPLTAAAIWLVRRLGARGTLQTLGLAALALLAAYGLRSAVLLTVYRADSPAEPLVYEASTPAVGPLMERVRRLARDVTGTQRTIADPTGGHGLAVALDPAVEWPARWYLRDFPALQVGYDPATLRGNATDPQLIFRAPESAQPTGYTEQRYKLSWSYPAGEPSAATADSGIQRLLAFVLFRKNVPLPAGSEIVVGYNGDLAARLFPQPAAQGPFGLGERAGLGKAPGQFDSPRGVAVAPDGSVYVVDMRNARVQRFGRDGAFLKQFGSPGRGDGQLWRESGRGPTGIAIDHDGNVYVADTWNHRVQKFGADGAFLAKWGSYSNLVAASPMTDRAGFFGPRGIAVAPNGEVYVTDTGNGRVVVFGKDGAFLREIGSKGKGPDQLDEPVGIAVSADGSRVYVADSNNARVSVFDPQGQPVAQWPVESWRGKAFFEPYLALDGDGALYATSSTTREVLKLNREGRVVNRSSGTPPDDNLSAPMGIAVAPDRTLYVSDTTRNAVIHLQPLADR